MGVASQHQDRVRTADRLLRELFPICRSITGNGVRRSLGILRDVVDFQTSEVPSGTQCFDWTIPDEWNVTDAFIADAAGRRVVDFRANNLHLVSYSEPVDRTMAFAELRPHLHSLPNRPDTIPYRTSYYRRTWGFCLSQRQLDAMDQTGSYRVVIDTKLAAGSLTYGERLLRGTDGPEYLVSTYCCHPSMANDNLSGMIVWTLVLRELAEQPTRNSYRFVVAPETLGSIAYLARNADAMRRVAGGYVLSSTGGPGPIGYMRTFRGDAIVDRAALLALRDRGGQFAEYPFRLGSDERNYSGPAWRIPIGTICKDKYHHYPQYHSSDDDLSFVTAEALAETTAVYLEAIANLERNRVYVSNAPPCEPQLGKRGLYPLLGGAQRPGVSHTESLLTNLFWADGEHPLIDVAERSGIAMSELAAAAEQLVGAGLLEERPSH